MKTWAQWLSHVPVLATPWTVACQAPLSMEFSRQEYWSRLPFPTPDGEISITSDNVDDTTPVAESEEELKSLLMKGKEESEKAHLKLNIQKTKIMASSPITSWQIDGETMETVTDFIFLGSEITADSDCSHGIKRHLLLGRKAMTNLDSILKSRDITLLTKVCIVKVVVFPVVMYGCESWTMKRLSAKELMLLNYDAGEDS